MILNSSLKYVCSIVFSLLIFACAAVPTDHHQYSVGVNSKVRTVSYNAWDNDCQTRKPSIRVVTKPKHGTLSIKPEKMKLVGSKAKIGSVGLCAGRTVIGSVVFYAPKAGLKGTDEFLLESTVPGRPNAYRSRVTITVR